MTPLVSLIVPNYNHTPQLPALFDSVRMQSLKSVEIIVADDGSDIPCEPVIAAYQALGLDIRLCGHCPGEGRLGAHAMRLRALAVARGDIIAFADADDVMLDEYSLEAHTKLLLAENADIVHFRTYAVQTAPLPSGIAVDFDPLAERLDGASIFAAYVESGLRCEYLWCKLYTRELIERALADAPPLHLGTSLEDIWLTTLCMLHARRYRGSARVGYRHSYHVPPQRHAQKIAAAYTLINVLEPLLRCHGIEERLIGLFRGTMKDIMRNYCRHILALAQNESEISTESLKDALHGVDPLLVLRGALLASQRGDEVAAALQSALRGNGKN